MAIAEDEGLRKKLKNIEELSKLKLVFGLVDETKRNINNQEFVWKYAITFEKGSMSNNQPSRPFFAYAIQSNWDFIISKAKKEYGKCMNGYLLPLTAYKNLGDYIRTLIFDSLLNQNWEKLKPYTIAQKGHFEIGIDTGAMIESLGYEILRDNKVVYRKLGRGGKI